MPKDEDEIVTSEACAILAVDRSWLTRLVQDGKLAPARKLPGRTGAYLFRRGDVKALAAERAEASSNQPVLPESVSA